MSDDARMILGRRRWIVRRVSTASTKLWLYRLVAIAVALSCAAGGLAAFGNGNGQNPLTQTIHTTFGTGFGIDSFIILASPLILTGVTVAIGRRANLWNVGGEGQLFIGAWLATAIAFKLPHLTGSALIPLMLIASAVGGMIWIAIPALMRVYLGMNEIVTTLMLNFIAGLWTSYWAVGPWASAASHGTLASRTITQRAWMPNFVGGGLTVSFGIFVAIAVVLAIAVGFRWSVSGYRVSIIGGSARAGTYAGMNVRRHLLLVLLLSGAVAGLAGGVELTSDIHAFSPELSNNTGYIGIAIAVLGGTSFLAVGAMGFVIAGVLALGVSAQFAGVSSETIFVVIGVMLLFSALAEVASHFRLIRVQEEAPARSFAERVPATANTHE